MRNNFPDRDKPAFRRIQYPRGNVANNPPRAPPCPGQQYPAPYKLQKLTTTIAHYINEYTNLITLFKV